MIKNMYSSSSQTCISTSQAWIITSQCIFLNGDTMYDNYCCELTLKPGHFKHSEVRANLWTEGLLHLLNSETGISVEFGTQLSFKIQRLLLAHLSQRLTRWAYRMGLEPASVRPCVRPCVRPHFQTWISPRPAGRLQPNFIWRILGVGERLH